MDEGFQRHPGHKRAGQQKMRKREFSQLENEKRGKQVWKERAEPALNLLEHLENSRMAWDDIIQEWRKVQEEEESVPVGLNAMGI